MNFQPLAGSPGSGSGSGSAGSGALALSCGSGSGSGSMPVLSHSGSAAATSPAQAQPLVLSNSAAIRAEIQRFESVHPNIYSIYDLIERIEDMGLQNQIREHVISIEALNNLDEHPVESYPSKSRESRRTECLVHDCHTNH